MRLYLSSDGVGDRAGTLLALLGQGRRAVVIGNARDGATDAAPPRALADLATLGIAATPLDLRHYFGNEAGLRLALRGADLVWALGGNSFILRRAMRQSGFDDVILDLLEADEIVYGGCAAGAAVAAPSLRGLEAMHDPAAAPQGYEPCTIWQGLGLIDHAIVPHYRSQRPESAAADRVARALSGRAMRYRALRDGDVIVWTEERRRIAVEERSIA